MSTRRFCFQRLGWIRDGLARNGEKVKGEKPVFSLTRHVRFSVLRSLIFTTFLFVVPTDGPLIAQASPGVDEFVIRPGNILQISIWPDNQLGGEFPIEDTGIIYLPLLGPIPADGLPINEFRSALRERYGLVMQSPVVTVTPLFEVSVLGAVRQPGLYQVTPSQGVYSVISMAGGFLQTAKEDEVRVVGDSGVRYLDAESALESGEELSGSRLQTNDRIIVPEGTRITTGTVLSIIQSVGIAVTIVALFTSGNSGN